MQNRESFLRKEIVGIGKLLYNRGLIVATDGNISTRINKNLILITPAGFCKGWLKQQDIIRMNINNKPLLFRNKLKPTTEYRMHLSIYKKRPEIKAIIHAHPAYTTALASTKTTSKQRGLDWFLTLSEMQQTVGKIGIVKAIPPGTQELASAVANSIAKTNASLMTNHGVVVVGENLMQALYRLERIEFAAKIFLLAELFNEISAKPN